MSQTENMLHVLRMPVPEEPGATVTPFQFHMFIMGVMLVGLAFVIGLGRWV